MRPVTTTTLSHASALPWSPMKLAPSSETSATISAWPWRKMLKSTRNCLPWFLLIYICLTLWLMEPVSLSRPWRRADTHFTGEMRWDGLDWLADCHWVTGASLNCLCTVVEIYFVCEWVCTWQRFCFAPVWMRLWMWVVSLTQITHCTLTVVTAKGSCCQVGPASSFKDWQTWINDQRNTMAGCC